MICLFCSALFRSVLFLFFLSFLSPLFSFVWLLFIICFFVFLHDYLLGKLLFSCHYSLTPSSSFFILYYSRLLCFVILLLALHFILLWLCFLMSMMIITSIFLLSSFLLTYCSSLFCSDWLSVSVCALPPSSFLSHSRCSANLDLPAISFMLARQFVISFFPALLVCSLSFFLLSCSLVRLLLSVQPSSSFVPSYRQMAIIP